MRGNTSLVAASAVSFSVGGYLIFEALLFSGSDRNNKTISPPRRSGKTFSEFVSETTPSFRLFQSRKAFHNQIQRGATSLLPSVLASFGLGTLCYVITAVPALAALGAITGAYLPFAVSKARRRRIAERARACWPDACRHLVANLQVGDSLPRALAALGSSGPAELRPHFARFARRYSATGDFDGSIETLSQELSYAGIERQLAVIRLAHRSGGPELVAVLKTAAELASESLATERDLKARQSWTVTAARVSAAAPWVILVLLSLRPTTAAVYSTALGTKVILGGAICSVLGYGLMSKIGKVPTQ